MICKDQLQILKLINKRYSPKKIPQQSKFHYRFLEILDSWSGNKYYLF